MTTYGLNEAGLFYSGEFRILGLQFLEVVVIISWTTATTLPFFLILNKLDLLRVPDEIQDEGLDAWEMTTPRIPFAESKLQRVRSI
mmetsp:Transcript_25421/g.34940  ORF Transcript_25421/g.34940 Transcript_25421/m.34940 type:complete len:86 (+) Transcript_25421:1-258(+)